MLQQMYGMQCKPLKENLIKKKKNSKISTNSILKITWICCSILSTMSAQIHVKGWNLVGPWPLLEITIHNKIAKSSI